MNQNRFGRHSEKKEEYQEESQEKKLYFNELEVIVDGATKEKLVEPTMEEIEEKRKKRVSHKKKGKREEDLKDFLTLPVFHTLAEEEYHCDCGGTY